MTLHILNGDNSLAIFNKTSIPGQSIAWPEILCEGPITEDIFSSEFRYMRYNFLRETYNTSKGEYDSKIHFTIESLKDTSAYNSIYLWFETDLFCYVNLLALAHNLSRHIDPSQKVFIVCPESENSGKFIGLGELEADDFLHLYKNAKEVNSDDLLFLSNVWQAYSGSDPRVLLRYLDRSISALPHLGQVILAHCRRFPSRDHGIDKLRIKIIRSIAENSFENHRSLLKFLLENQGIYGFGDLQYELLIKELSPLIQSEEILKLNPIGKSVMNGQIDYQEFNRKKEHLGGANSREYRWWEEKRAFIAQYHESSTYTHG